MRLYFELSEFVITGETIPVDVANKIIHYHMLPLNDVRAHLGRAIWPSQNSCYRPVSWEKKRGRSGRSQHCFLGKGAVDLTWSGDIDELLHALIEFTDYTRMAIYYDNRRPFIHCDYKSDDGKRYIFKSTPNSKWTFLRYA